MIWLFRDDTPPPTYLDPLGRVGPGTHDIIFFGLLWTEKNLTEPKTLKFALASVIKVITNKKILLRECKRHNIHRIVSTRCAALSPGGGTYPYWGSTYPR